MSFERLRSNHVVVLCQRGAEAALKRELSRSTQTLHAGYQRPGMVTFRSDQPVTPDVSVNAVLARHAALSLGTFQDRRDVLSRISELPQPLRLHVVERDLYRPDEAPPSYAFGELAREIEADLRSALPEVFLPDEEAQVGELVLDVVVAPGDPWLLGVHRHRVGLSPFPGGHYRYALPEDVPSRAYRKIEEAILAFDLPVRGGDTALELGAAPGGAAYALLRRGVSVFGVDPADMDPHTLAYVGPHDARLVHLRMPMAQVQRHELPARIDWLLMDVHLAPQVALRTAARFASTFRSSLLGVVLTLKLNDWRFLDDLEKFIARAREMGIEQPVARQLPAHRQEICVVGLTSLGRRRR